MWMSLYRPEVCDEHYFKVPVCIRDDFVISLEEHVIGTFIHCTVTTYNATVKRQIQENFEAICRLHGGPIYALHDSRDRKKEKFQKMFGFQRLTVLPNLHEIWIWRNTNGKSIQK